MVYRCCDVARRARLLAVIERGLWHLQIERPDIAIVEPERAAQFVA
jgi:hypothetical protein